jgi:hypothetical protein
MGALLYLSRMGRSKYQPLILDQKNPFKEAVERSIKTTTDSDNGLILNEEVTITRKRQYIKGQRWVKLTQDKDLLRDLSPWGWQILGFIALNLEMNQEQMKLDRREIGMDKRKYSETMVELLGKRILASTGKRQHYWINVGLIIVGNIQKHEE